MGSAGWFVDPLGGHEKRYFNGWTWTDRVSDGPNEASDPLGNVAPPSPTLSSYARGFPPETVSPYARGFPPQQVVVAPQPVGNGFAVAGLTLGVIGVVIMTLMWFGFFLGLPCGVLGLIFGLAGRRKARTGAPYRGIATAGVVLGSLAVVMAIYGAVAFFSFTNAIRHAISTPTTAVVADASPSLNSVHVNNCYQLAGSGSPAATGTLVNASSQTQSFKVTIVFQAGQSTAQGAATTGRLAPGETGDWTVVGAGSSFPPTSCAIVPPPATSP